MLNILGIGKKQMFAIKTKYINMVYPPLIVGIFVEIR